jgi:hypothetical protein
VAVVVLLEDDSVCLHRDSVVVAVPVSAYYCYYQYWIVVWWERWMMYHSHPTNSVDL